MAKHTKVSRSVGFLGRLFSFVTLLEISSSISSIFRIFISLIIRTMNLKLTQQEREQIKQLHRGCKQRKHADKLKAILLLADGFSCVDVGKILLLDDDTIRSYRNT